MKRYIFLLSILLSIFFIFQTPRVHIVKKGDTLWDIASYYYGNPFFWVAIWKVNIDKIEDPHWIYPGQEFFIPEIPPIEGVLYPVYEPKVIERKVPIPFEEVEIKVVAPPVPAVAKDLVLSSGLVVPKNKITFIGIIVGSEEDKEKFFFWDKLYINKGSLDGIKVEDKFVVFKLGKEIRSKRRKISLGNLVVPLGVIKVERLEERSSLALLEKTYDIINSKEKNYFKEIEFPEIPTDVKIVPVKDRKIEAEIVYIKEGSDTEVIPFKIVFIDVGKNDAVKIGDLFEIYREGKVIKDPQTSEKIKLPYIFMGTLQVINISDYASTCYVRSVAKSGIKVGDKVRLVGEVVRK
ncbi:MAG: LysM peptidoglycan-binding domain-containing protein [Candidatus Hydrothermales bacterium]